MNFLHTAKVTTSYALHVLLLKTCTRRYMFNSYVHVFCYHPTYLTHFQSQNFYNSTSFSPLPLACQVSAQCFEFGFPEIQPLHLKYLLYLSESLEFQHHAKEHLQPFPAHSYLQISYFIFLVHSPRY